MLFPPIRCQKIQLSDFQNKVILNKKTVDDKQKCAKSGGKQRQHTQRIISCYMQGKYWITQLRCIFRRTSIFLKPISGFKKRAKFRTKERGANLRSWLLRSKIGFVFQTQKWVQKPMIFPCFAPKYLSKKYDMPLFNQNGIRKASRYYYWSRVSETTVPDLTIAAEYIAVPSTSPRIPLTAFSTSVRASRSLGRNTKYPRLRLKKKNYADGNFLPLLFGTIRVLQLSNPLPLES